MPTITYNCQTVTSEAYPRELMRRALYIAERWGIEMASVKLRIDQRMVRKWCHQAEIRERPIKRLQ